MPAFPLPTCRTASALAFAVALLAGCASGPDYVRPAVDAPAAYKEAAPIADPGWKVAEPQLAASGQPWWSAYGDPVLDGLMRDADAANQTLRASEAQYRQAKALADQARAGYYPTASANAGAQRARANSNGVRIANTDTLGLSASWQPDLWGSVRRSVEANEADTAASADDLAAARLSIQSELAQDYLQLRTNDRLIDLYAATTAAYERSLKLAQAQYAAGVALPSDVAQAESQLATAQAEGVDLKATRSQLEHAIAILTGRAPAAFALSAVPAFDLPPVVVPPGLPSQLLERRPDIAAAERRAAAANAQIGVARAAYYPALTLSASGGYAAASFGALFDAPSRVWSLGAALAQTLFDGGLRKARDAQAVAAYDAAVANYRQTVLTGFQQVEDNLSTLRVLGDEAVLQDRAVQAAQRAERQALAQYRAGTNSYVNVVTAQAASLAAQRSAVQLRGRQLVASVSLVVASGGGWRAGDEVQVSQRESKR